MIKTNQTVIAMMVIANNHGIVRRSAYSEEYEDKFIGGSYNPVAIILYLTSYKILIDALEIILVHDSYLSLTN